MKKEQWESYFNNIKDQEGNHVEIPLSGTLSLLAQGDIAVMAWKYRRAYFIQKQKEDIIKSKQSNN